MVLPIFGLLAGAGVLGAKAYYQNTANENPSYLNSLLGIQRQQQPMANIGRLDLQSPLMAQQLQALAAQAETPQQQQYYLDRAIAAQQNQLSFEERMMGAQQANQAAQIQQAQQAEIQRYERAQDLAKREDAFRKEYVREFSAFANAQSTFQALEGTLANGSAQDAVAATFQIMKTLDPTSTVRTEEGRQVYQADGAMAGLANQLNRLLGEGWNESTRRGWYDTVSRAYRPQAERTYRALADWNSRAQEQGYAASATRGAGIDRERLRGTVEGNRPSPFPVRQTAPAVREDDNYIYSDEPPNTRYRTRRQRGT